MTPNEKSITEAVSALRLAVHDLHYAFGEMLTYQRSRDGDSAPLQELQAYLSGCQRELETAHCALERLGYPRPGGLRDRRPGA